MLPASNSGVGMNIGFPDVCTTPVGPVPTPIPYPNMALNATAVPFTPNVLISFVPGLNIAAEMPLTLGDEAGVLSAFSGPGRSMSGDPVVMLAGLPAQSLLSPSSGNDCINALGAKLVPSITNVFYSRAGAPRLGAVDAAALTALSCALAETDLAETLSAEGVAMFKVPMFSSGVPARFYSALARWGERVRALVVDVRGCPGGELVAAVELAGDFLPSGATIVTTTDREGDETVYRARQGKPCEVPLVILVDRLSASAAEIFAGALQAHRRATLVGERTYGKGTIQSLVPRLEPGSLYDTVATWALANGESVDGRGLEPDVAITPVAQEARFSPCRA